MKTRVIIAACILMATVSFAQNQDLNDMNNIAPQFKGTSTINQSEPSETISDYLKKYVEYPSISINCRLQGTEVVQFIITQNGEITGFKVINSVCPKIDQEVIRVLKTTNGKWNPGTINGNKVEMGTEVSVAFVMNSYDDLIKTAKHYQKKGNNWMFTKNNPEKALKYYNRGITLLPNEVSLLAMRSLCNYEMGNINEAEKDWKRIKTLANNKSESNLENEFKLFDSLHGFPQMMSAIKK